LYNMLGISKRKKKQKTKKRAWLAFYGFGFGMAAFELVTGNIFVGLATVVLVGLNIKHDIKYQVGAAAPSKTQLTK
jgi:hypothetical protein